MRCRSLKHKVTFQESQELQNDFGEITNDVVDILTCRASIQTITGKETFTSNQNYSTLSHKLRVRYSSKINAKQKIIFGSRVFNILAVLNIFEKNKELEILVEEALNDWFNFWQ